MWLEILVETHGNQVLCYFSDWNFRGTQLNLTIRHIRMQTMKNTQA